MQTTTTTDAGQRLTSLLMTARKHSLPVTQSRLERPVQHATTDYQRVARKDVRSVRDLDKRLIALLDECEA